VHSSSLLQHCTACIIACAHKHTHNRVATPAGFTLESSGSDDVFTIMPATFEPGKKGPFHLSVVCDAEFRLTRDRGGGQRASVVGTAAAAAAAGTGGTGGTASASASASDGAAGSSKHQKGASSSGRRPSTKQPSPTAAAVAPAPVATTTATAATTAATASASSTVAATSAAVDDVAALPSLHKQPSATAAATLGVVTSPFANTAGAAGVSTRRGSPGGMR
jgi:hypothetical protein